MAGLWSEVPVQRCTVHKHRNLLAHAPRKLCDEVIADYTDMIYARTAKEVAAILVRQRPRFAKRHQSALIWLASPIANVIEASGHGSAIKGRTHGRNAPV